MSGGKILISDGLTSKTARVDARNRLHTLAITRQESVDASLEGDTFFITTGLVNLTSNDLSYFLFVKNNEKVDWIIDSLIGGYGATDGTGDSFNLFNVGAENGTLISSGFDLPAINLNIGSPEQLDATIKLGGEGSTITDGQNTPPTLIPATTTFRRFTVGQIIIPPGTNFSIAYQPPTGNTGQNVDVQIVLHRGQTS